MRGHSVSIAKILAIIMIVMCHEGYQRYNSIRSLCVEGNTDGFNVSMEISKHENWLKRGLWELLCFMSAGRPCSVAMFSKIR